MKPEDFTDKDKQLLLWYFDRWLPAVAGKLYWTQKVRYYRKVTDKMIIGGGGDLKVCVTSSSEGFGLMILDNCRTKWQNIFKLKQTDPNAKIPTVGDDADKYHAKFTDNKCGGIKFGGWCTAGLERFQQIVTQIRNLRQRDNEKHEDESIQSFALQHMRTTHDIKQEAPGKKRKTATQPTEETAPTKKLQRYED